MEQSLTLEFEKKFDKQGYVLIKVNNNWTFEHRYNVEQFILRKLTNEEKVHHIDFNRKNNHLNNLVIFPNTNSHSHWHRQYKQFKLTKPLLRELNQLKELMIIERIKKMELI
jgi:hypothetical protein